MSDETKPAPGTRCSARVWPSYSMRDQPCARKAKVVEGGKPWCTQHSPAKARERRAARDRQWEEDRKREEKRSLEHEAYRAICRMTLADAERVGHGFVAVWRRIMKHESVS